MGSRPRCVSVMQSKTESLIEALVNTAVGFVINYFANIVVLHAAGFPVGPGKAFVISMVFTVISIVRGYAIRRWAQAHLNALIRRITNFVTR